MESCCELQVLIEIFSLIVAILGFGIAIWKINLSRKNAEANTWLKLEDSFRVHNEVYFKLRPANRDLYEPDTSEEWGKIDDYLGLFELCNIMIRNKQISFKIFDSQYSYRVRNIIANKTIVSKKFLGNEKSDWKEFIELVNRLGLKKIIN